MSTQKPTDTPEPQGPSEEEAEQLKAKWGEVHLIGNEYGLAAFRLPNVREYQKFRDELAAGPQYRALAGRNLVTSCRVWPDKPAYEAMVAAHPGIVETFSGELIELAGAKAASVVRKL
jgi:hypothetical protein